MFDVGFAELIVIFVIALLVLGPERLPEVARTAGRWLGRARQMARSMQYELEREIDLNNIAGDSTSGKSAADETDNQKTGDGVEPLADAAEASAASVTPHPTYGRLPERTGADYDDDPEEDPVDAQGGDHGDFHAHDEALEHDDVGDHDSKADKAGG